MSRVPVLLRFCVLLAAAALAALTALPGAGPGPALAAPAALDKPDVPGFVPTRTVFPCEGWEILALAPGFTATLADTTAGAGLIDGYACRLWPETGPEIVFTLQTAVPLELFAALRDLDDRDLDLFLLGDCDSDSCLVGANVEFTAVLQAGTYFLVVDGYGEPTPQAGAFTLLLECREPGLPPVVCTGEASTPVLCQNDTWDFSGDLALEPNLLQSADCAPYPVRAGDAWYAVTLGPYQEFTATLTSVAEAMDPSLWVMGSCGAAPLCLAFVDDKTAGQSETLTWMNAALQDTTVYLGVDAFTPPTAAGEGAYDLQIRCQAMTPARKSSLGSVRALFR